MIYDLKLVLSHVFDRPTGGGRQHLRIIPQTLEDQSLLSHSLTVSPTPREGRSFTDFWGAQVVELVLPPGLTEVTITLQAKVTREAEAEGLDISPPLSALGPELAQITELGPLSPHHYRAPSPRIAADAAIAAFAEGQRAATTRATVEALGRALHARMRFDAKATEVDTPPARAFAQGAGVCQDFAQIMIGALRALGIPAAYEAGYLRTLSPPGKPRLEGADAMHAWVAAWCGVQAGWQSYDPTNACWVGADHLRVTRGRDYGDCAPVTGTLWAEGGQQGTHAVDLIALP